MKILELAGFVWSNTHRSICDLSNSLVQLGHEVTLADVRSDRSTRLLDPKVQVCDVTVRWPVDAQAEATFLNRLVRKTLSYARISQRNYRYMRRFVAHYRFVRAVASKVRLREYDIIHVHHGQQALVLLKRYRRPYVYTNHWQYWPGDTTLDARLERMAIRGARAAIGLGAYLQSFEPSGNHVVIPAGIDTNQWTPLDRTESREILGLSSEDFLVVFAGAVEHRKGVDLLVTAMQRLALQTKHIRLHVIGSLGRDSTEVGVYARDLMERARGLPVSFLGFLANTSAEFRRHLSAADVFVLPSRSEAQGLVVLEALAMGIPVVGSRVGGLGETVRPEVGYTFASGDTEELGRIIQYLHDEPKHREDLRRHCRVYVERYYSWKSVAARYVDVFKNASA